MPVRSSGTDVLPPVVRPVVEIRPESPGEAFDYLMYTLGQMPFYRQHGYDVALPEHAAFQALAQPGARVDGVDQARLRTVFEREVYREDDFSAGMHALDGASAQFEAVFPVFARFADKWGFRVFPRYLVLLTLYGPGGSYDSDRGQITLFTTRDGRFRRARGTDVIVHEMVHLGIEEVIVRRFGLEHWEKEGLVDRVCAIGLRSELPGYVVQSKGAAKLDPFVDEKALDDLPAAVGRYVAMKSRP